MKIFGFSVIAVLFCTFPLFAGYQELFKEGENLRSKRKYAEAQEYFRKASKEDGLNPDQRAFALERIGQCYFWMKKFESGITEMQKANDVPGITGYCRSDINSWIGDSYKNLKKYDDAVKFYEQAAQYAPVSMPKIRYFALMKAADCRKIQKKWQEAVAFLEKAGELKKLPVDLKNRAFMMIPEYCMAAADYKGVIKHAQIIMSRQDISASLRKKLQTMIGKAYFSMQQFEKAKIELKKAECMPDK